MKKKFKSLRNLFVISYDACAVIFSLFAAFLLRFNFDVPDSYVSFILSNVYIVFLANLVPYAFLRIDRLAIRYFSINDLMLILRSLLMSWLILLGFIIIDFILSGDYAVPRSIFILYPLLSIVFLVFPRVLYRFFLEKNFTFNSKHTKKNILIIGTDSEAISLSKLILADSNLHCCGFLTKDASLLNRVLAGSRVLGSIDLLKKVILKHNVTTVIIAINDISLDEKNNIIDVINTLSIEALVAPSVDNILSGSVSLSSFRKINIEDLLGREKSNLDNSKIISMFKGQTVLVTGAGGSIGSELCQQIIYFKPKKLLCLDISESSLYVLQQKIIKMNLSIEFEFLVTDVKNKNKINFFLNKFKPSLVFHAAAYKHVPLMEEMNISEALLNNAYGTYSLASLCQENNVKKFILVSTDKAVNPTSVMGASKRLAEMICQKIYKINKTQFITVRFGNVLASSGSVIPLFESQIRRGGPITVTDPKIKRFFMTISEASQLVLQSSLMGNGGEIFVLEMGKQIKILDLAQDMIRLSGFKSDEMPIIFTGLRKGEKLYEETFAYDERLSSTRHKKIMVAYYAKEKLSFAFDDLLVWLRSIESMDEQKIKTDIIKWIPEYINSK